MDIVAASLASTSLASYKLFLLLDDESKLSEESNLLKQLDVAAVYRLWDELRSVKCLLKDAYEKSEEEELSEPVKIWLSQTTDVAELVEDVVDEYILKPSRQRLNRGGFLFSNFFGRSGRLAEPFSDMPSAAAAKIQEVELLLREINERGEKFHLTERTETATVKPRFVSSPHVVEEFVVGFDSAENELIQRLTGGESKRSVVSLVGMEGIGKTTLAKKVFNNETVRGHFDFRVWIPVSHSYNRADLLKSMAMQICQVGEGIEAMAAQELISTISECLRLKRYMLVLDDVWDKEFWQFMKGALFDNDQGSRIIITTRSFAVATSCEESSSDHIHRVERLSEAMSWDLFCRIAFQYEPEQLCPPELKQLSLEILRVCEGVPLAIAAVAGLLSTKTKIVSEWRRMFENFYLQLKSDPHLVAIVSKTHPLSFHDLTYQLQMCFLYFSIFPEGSVIPCDKLFRLWIAEGFVRLKPGKSLEEVAEEYLNELIRRNLVQACEASYRLEKFCRVHSLMHVIACQIADVFSFCHVRHEKNSMFKGKSRRLSILNDFGKNVFETIRDSRVRSVFLSNIDSLSNAFLVTLFERYKLLKLLDFENVALDRLPEEVGNLFHLKYLSLKNTKVKRLPKSVGKLQNLQTMDVRNTLLVELPIEINMLQNLRHLLASHCHNKLIFDSTQGVIIKEGIRHLQKLQTLMTVEAHYNVIGLIKELKLLRLRRLCISRLTTEVASALCASIEQMGHLEYLSLQSRNDYEILDIQNISSASSRLQRLILKGRLQRFPNWISSLENLSLLCLSLSRLTDDPLREISVLPNLLSLWLYRAYDGERLHFEAGGFQKLKFLVLRDLEGLTVVEIEEGALPVLEELRIGPSPLLTAVPSGIRYLRSLKVVAFYDMPNDLVLSMQPDGGLDYWKVEHVPSVLFGYKVQGRQYTLYALGESDLLDRLQGLATNINDAVQHGLRLSFCYSDDDADSAAALTSIVRWNDMQRSFSRDQMSLSSDRFSFFSDDIED